MRLFASVVLRAVLAGAVVAVASSNALAQGEKTGSPQSERGRYLVGIMGCGDCHTPMKMTPNGPEPDRARFLSGHPATLKMPKPPALGAGPWLWAGAATNTAFAGPWGVTYSINLTSDEATGLGSWTEANFVKALKIGKHLGIGRPIQPPMPWQQYRTATDDDLKAIFAYLKTVPPIKNLAPEYEPPPAPVAPAKQ
jgi:hypothetical protein